MVNWLNKESSSSEKKTMSPNFFASFSHRNSFQNGTIFAKWLHGIQFFEGDQSNGKYEKKKLSHARLRHTKNSDRLDCFIIIDKSIFGCECVCVCALPELQMIWKIFLSLCSIYQQYLIWIKHIDQINLISIGVSVCEYERFAYTICWNVTKRQS